MWSAQRIDFTTKTNVWFRNQLAYISFYKSHSAQRSKTPGLVDRQELRWDFALLGYRARRRLTCHRYLGTAYLFHVQQSRCAKSKLYSSTSVPKRPRQTNIRRVTTQKREDLNYTTRKAENSHELSCTSYIAHLVLFQLHENTRSNVPVLTSALRREVW